MPMLPCDIEVSALTIDEILSSDYEPLPQSDRNNALAQARLADWIRISADGDEAAFLKRLERENKNVSMLLARLGGVRKRDGLPEPAWVAKTCRVVELLKRESTSLKKLRDERVSFAPLLSSIVEDATLTLWELLPLEIRSMVAPEAFETIVDHLRRRLSNLCELPFYQMLLNWRRDLLESVKSGDALASQLLMADNLDPFAQYMRTSGYSHLVREKPILFRLISTLMDQWQAAYLAFFRRLAKDRVNLAKLLSQPSTAARVSEIRWGLSDPHNGGHSVLMIEFEDGTRALYKPKDLRPDLFVQLFVTTLKQMGFLVPLEVPSLIALDGYGWTTFVELKPCDSEREVATYYYRFGAWLAIFYTLSTSDMHMENFLAQGAAPIPVDFEMILQGLRQRPQAVTDDTEAQWLTSRFLEASVQSVGMLPAYVTGQNGSIISMGALESSTYPITALEWDSINTPRMVLRSTSDQIVITSNLPKLHDQAIEVARFRVNFLDGFKQTMHFLAQQGESVFQALGGVHQLHFTIRKVVRPTRFYYMLLKRLYDHRKMVDSVSWSLEADFVARFFDWESNTEQPWKLAASERRQLLMLDIPHFTMFTESNIIKDNWGPVTRLHLDLGPEVMRLRLKTLNSDVIRSQVDIVRASVQLSRTTNNDTNWVADGLTLARELHSNLMRQSFQSSRSISWIGLNRIDHEVAAQLSPIGYDLYYGSAGIAFFLAALAKSGNLSAKVQCRQALNALMQTVSSAKLSRLVRAIGIGGAVGLGSMVYALAVIGEIIGDSEVLKAADMCARGITLEMINKDDKFDVVAGSAGACLGLLSLYKRTGTEWLVERAIACGEHLLRHRNHDCGQWISSSFSSPLTGMAHGSAGIALAMSRLYAVSGEQRFRQAAQDSVEFENKYYNLELGNWIDLRTSYDQAIVSTPNQWCYGAAGIGLARLSMQTDYSLPPEVLASDIARSLDAVLKDKGGRSSGLCCGDAGLMECLVTAGTRLERPDLLVEAKKRLDFLLEIWNSTGDLNWIGGSSNYNPGLFQGLSGVAYVGLRAEGVEMPSPLIWD